MTYPTMLGTHPHQRISLSSYLHSDMLMRTYQNVNMRDTKEEAH